MRPRRPPGGGWLALLGGGEFSFGETAEADRAWTEKLAKGGEVGFLPAASGSTEYGGHFAAYLDERFSRRVDTIPVYRSRDARRGKNCQRIRDASGIYLGGGVAGRLVDALRDSPCLDALGEHLSGGGVVAAITAAAQALGEVGRGVYGSGTVAGLGWLPGGAVEANFEPAHDRRLRGLLAAPGVDWGLGIASSSAVLLGPDEAIELVGEAWILADPEGDLEPISPT